MFFIGYLFLFATTGEKTYSINKCFERPVKTSHYPEFLPHPHVCLSLEDNEGKILDSRCLRKAGPSKEQNFNRGDSAPREFRCYTEERGESAKIREHWDCICDIFDSAGKYRPWNHCRTLSNKALKKCVHMASDIK